MKKLNLDINPLRDVTAMGSLVFYGLLLLFVASLQEWSLLLELFLGFVITYGVALLIRSFYFKSRPSKQKYKKFIERLDAASFPSIHASRISFIALSFCSFFNNIFTSTLLLFVVVLVLYSRIHLHKHDWKDLLGGIILAALTWYLLHYLMGF